MSDTLAAIIAGNDPKKGAAAILMLLSFSAATVGIEKEKLTAEDLVNYAHLQNYEDLFRFSLIKMLVSRAGGDVTITKELLNAVQEYELRSEDSGTVCKMWLEKKGGKNEYPKSH